MELVLSRLIKLILGILVVVAVVLGVYFFFKSKVIELFKDLPVNVTGDFVLLILSENVKRKDKNFREK